MPDQQSEDIVHVSDITLRVEPQFNKTIRSIVFKTEMADKPFREAVVKVAPGDKHKELFDPAHQISSRDKLFVVVKCPTLWHFYSRRTIDVALSDVKAGAKDHGNGERAYSKVEKNIEVTIGLSSLKSVIGNRSDNSLLNANPTLARGTPPPPTSADADLKKETISPVTSIPSNRDASATGSPSMIVPAGADSESGTLPPLISTTDEILSKCPRFRLLIIGNTGVGKTSLVQKVFGVKEVQASAGTRGISDINREYTAIENERFVVHDSLGFEAGESNNFGIVKRFIKERQAKPDLKDRLHAIWVCITVPYADGRLLEAGIEDLLRNKESLVGNIPIVVVLTKLDYLDATLLQRKARSGIAFKSLEDALRIIEQDRSNFLENNCSEPLKAVVKGNIPHVAVSTISKPGQDYRHTIPELVRTTISEIEGYIKAEERMGAPKLEQQNLERTGPSVVAGMAQRVDIEEKVRLTIEVGQKKYWKKLDTNSPFRGRPVKTGLLILHEDIIQVWNFHDPERGLHDKEFQEALLDAPKIDAESTPDARPLGFTVGQKTHDPVGVAAVHAITKIHHFVTQVFDGSSFLPVRQFMAYIVDLVYVMKNLFIRAPNGSVTRQDVFDALREYKENDRDETHDRISDFEATSKPEKDVVLETILDLIKVFPIRESHV